MTQFSRTKIAFNVINSFFLHRFVEFNSSQYAENKGKVNSPLNLYQHNPRRSRLHATHFRFGPEFVFIGHFDSGQVDYLSAPDNYQPALMPKLKLFAKM